jgi:hypothetical protein
MPVRYRVPMRTAEDHWRPTLGLTSLEVGLLTHLHHVDQPTSQDKTRLPALVSGTPLTPFVNNGRWLVRCPYCPGAMHASKFDQRFMCGEASCPGPKNVWLPVVWPADTDRIEALLAVRPSKSNRNWEPPESVAFLEQENKDRGIPLAPDPNGSPLDVQVRSL